MRTLIATLIALMLFAATPVAAGDVEDGFAAYRSGDCLEAFRLWKRAAEHGHLWAVEILPPLFLTIKCSYIEP